MPCVSTPLFDATDSSPDITLPRTASWFERASRSSDAGWTKVHRTLDSWYSRYPDQTGDLRSRLRANDQNRHSAFFELFLHELFLRAGLCVTVGPELPTRSRPDFLVRGPTGHAVYIEATVVEGDRDSPHEQLVLDAINELDDAIPRGVGVVAEAFGTLSAAPPVRRLKSRVRDWLNCVRLGDAPRRITIPPPTVDGDWSLTLHAVQRETGGVVQASSRKVVEFGKTVREALKVKASQHRTDEWPVVLAVNDLNRYFDEECISFREFWVAHPGIAAALIFDRCVPWDDADNWGLHIETNPALERRLPREVLTWGDSAGPSTRELLRLPAGWPDPERSAWRRAWRESLSG